MNEETIEKHAILFTEEYIVDVSRDRVTEIFRLKAIHVENLGKAVLPPQDLHNRLREENLDIPVSVAGAERSCSRLTILKSDLLSTMGQLRLSSVGMLYFNSTFARQLNLTT